MNWDTVKLFLALHREGSARAVALEHDLSPSTVTRRISELEGALGNKLFNRLPSGFELTESGEELLHVALTMESNAYEIERRLLASCGDMDGMIRVTVPSHITTTVLMGALANFSSKNPKVEIELIPSYDAFDLSRGEADIAIRMMYRDSAPPDNLIGSKLVEVFCAVYAHKDYIEMHDLGDAESSNWIGWDDESRFPDWVVSSAYPHLPVRHRFKDPFTQLLAVKAGMGLAMLPCFLCDPEPELVRVPSHVKWHRFDLWMLSHPDLRETLRFKEFRRFLREEFYEQRAFWMGDCNSRLRSIDQ